MCKNPPEDEVHFCPTDETFVNLPVWCTIPGAGVYGIRDHSEIKVGAYPERIVGEDPLVDALMAEPDTQRVQTILGKAMFWGEQADRWLSRSADDTDIRIMTYKTLNVSCRGSNASLRVTGSQILRCTPPALYDKEKV